VVHIVLRGTGRWVRIHVVQSGVEAPHTQSGRMLDDRAAAYASEVICHVNKGNGTEINEVPIS
jgi:hypothetical protein